MKVYVRLHNSVAVTGLLKCINLSHWHIHCGGQISWSWPWSTSSINHNLMRQKWCHIELAGRSTYPSRHVQGWSDPWWLMSLITLNSTVTQWDWVEYGQQTGNQKVLQQALLMFGNTNRHIMGKLLSMVWRCLLQAGGKTVTWIWRQQDEFSRGPENNDQAPDLSGPREFVLAFPADFLYEINSFMAIGV